MCGQTSTAPGGSKNSPEAPGEVGDGTKVDTFWCFWHTVASNIEKLTFPFHICWLDVFIKNNAFFFNQQKELDFFPNVSVQVVSGGGLRVNHDIVLRKVLWTSKYPGQVHICRHSFWGKLYFIGIFNSCWMLMLPTKQNIFVFMHGKFRCCCRGVLHWWYHPPISAQPSTEHVGM